MPSSRPHPGSRLWRRILGGALLVAVAGVALAWFCFREPRIAGRPLSAWVESLGPVDQDNLRETFRGHATVHDLRSLNESSTDVTAALVAELPAASRSLARARSWYQWKARLWAESARSPWLASWFSAPRPDVSMEAMASARMFWGTALLIELAPSPFEGLRRFEAVVSRLPETMTLQCTQGFRALTDAGHALEQALIQRLEDPAADGARRALWLACLAGLGDQAAGVADPVRVLTADPDARVRQEAIKALGRIDGRPDTADFLQASARDVSGRQAAMLALAQMGPRARPAEEFIHAALQDRDLLTSLFAKFALEALEKGSPPMSTNR